MIEPEIQEALDLAIEIQKNIALGNAHFMEACRGLYTAFKRKDWLRLGYETVEEYWQGQLTLQLETSAIRNRIGVAKDFGERTDIAGVNLQRLIDLRPFNRKWKGTDKLENALVSALEDSPFTWRNNLREWRGQIPSDSPACLCEDTYLVRICKKCNGRVPVE